MFRPRILLLPARGVMTIGELMERPWLKNLRNAAATIRAIGFFALPIVGLLAALYVTSRRVVGPEVQLAVASGLTVVTLTALGFLTYIRWFQRLFQYEVLEVKGTLLIEEAGDHHRYTYTKHQKVRALRPNLRLVEFKAHWTGKSSRGKLRVEPVYGEHVVLDGQHSEEDGRIHRWVYIGRPAGRSEVLDVGIQHTHEDDMGQQRPYYRDGGGAFRTGRLVVMASFPQAQEPAGVQGAVWNTHLPVGQNNLVGPYHAERVVNAATKTVDYVVTVRRPKRHHSYGVRWSWARPASSEGLD
jgi:hypothetical protein